jgi:O-antigen/teichoic acid export membrane protein
MFGAIFNVPLNYLYWFILTKFYSSSDIGTAGTLLNLIIWISLFLRFGLDDSLRRFLPELNKDKYQILSAILIFVSVLTLTISPLFFLFSSFFIPNLYLINQNLLFLIIITLFTLESSILAILSGIFIGEKSTFWVSMQSVIISSVRIILVIFFVKFGFEGIIFSSGLSWLVSLIILVFVVKKYLKYKFELKIFSKINKIKEISFYSLNSYLVLIISSLPISFLPIIILFHFNSNYVAYFQLSWMISSSVYIIPSSFFISFITSSVGKSIFEIKKNLIFSIIIIFSFYFIFILFILLFGKLFINFFGTEYTNNSYDLLLLFTITGIIMTLNGANFAKFRLKKKLKKEVIANLAIVSMTFFGVLFFIDTIGLISIGYFCFISQFSVFLILFFIEFSENLNLFKIKQ